MGHGQAQQADCRAVPAPLALQASPLPGSKQRRKSQVAALAGAGSPSGGAGTVGVTLPLPVSLQPLATWGPAAAGAAIWGMGPLMTLLTAPDNDADDHGSGFMSSAPGGAPAPSPPQCGQPAVGDGSSSVDWGAAAG